MPVVDAAGTVLLDPAAELAQGHQVDAGHARADVGGEGGQRLAELGELVVHPAVVALAEVDVHVPVAHVERGDAQADAGLDQPRDVAQAVAEPPLGYCAPLAGW